LVLADINLFIFHACEEKSVSIFRMKCNQKHIQSFMAPFQTDMVNQNPSGCAFKFPSFQNIGTSLLIQIELRQPQSTPNHCKTCIFLESSVQAAVKLHRQANRMEPLQVMFLVFTVDTFLEEVNRRNSFKVILPKRPVYNSVAGNR
ncbi:hypothetical protein TorRG33x02_286730, partial [Trema orientale]